MYKNKIAVITPTIRPEGLDIVQKALEKQTFTDFDWYIGSSFIPKCDWATWVKDDFKGGCWTLNRIYNALIRATEAPLIVSWQDYTSGDETLLERLWECYEKNPKALVSVTGNKYYEDDFFLESWFDPRTSNIPFRETGFHDVEWNLCSCPREALVKCGGFIEDLDFFGFGMDGFCVNERLSEMGYKFFVDSTVKTYSLMHGRVPNWEEKNLLYKWNEVKDKLKSLNKWPIVEYLK
jgi:hypothetical protein